MIVTLGSTISRLFVSQALFVANNQCNKGKRYLSTIQAMY